MNGNEGWDRRSGAAVLVIAHGSRRAAANEELAQMAALLQQRLPDWRVERAYLELASPSIPEGLERCRAGGARRIVMLPYFLSPGNHVVEDLEGHRREFVSAHPDCACRLAGPIGLHPLLAEILLDRLREAAESAATSS